MASAMSIFRAIGDWLCRTWWKLPAASHRSHLCGPPATKNQAVPNQHTQEGKHGAPALQGSEKQLWPCQGQPELPGGPRSPRQPELFHGPLVPWALQCHKGPSGLWAQQCHSGPLAPWNAARSQWSPWCHQPCRVTTAPGFHEATQGHSGLQRKGSTEPQGFRGRGDTASRGQGQPHLSVLPGLSGSSPWILGIWEVESQFWPWAPCRVRQFCARCTSSGVPSVRESPAALLLCVAEATLASGKVLLAELAG